jgi:hypothetical protein
VPPPLAGGRLPVGGVVAAGALAVGELDGVVVVVPLVGFAAVLIGAYEVPAGG